MDSANREDADLEATEIYLGDDDVAFWLAAFDEVNAGRRTLHRLGQNPPIGDAARDRRKGCCCNYGFLEGLV